jgi:hypothetical protein
MVKCSDATARQEVRLRSPMNDFIIIIIILEEVLIFFVMLVRCSR